MELATTLSLTGAERDGPIQSLHEDCIASAVALMADKSLTRAMTGLATVPHVNRPTEQRSPNSAHMT
jgi:hypothetical protein